MSHYSNFTPPYIGRNRRVRVFKLNSCRTEMAGVYVIIYEEDGSSFHIFFQYVYVNVDVIKAPTGRIIAVRDCLPQTLLLFPVENSFQLESCRWILLLFGNFAPHKCSHHLKPNAVFGEFAYLRFPQKVRNAIRTSLS